MSEKGGSQCVPTSFPGASALIADTIPGSNWLSCGFLGRISLALETQQLMVGNACGLVKPTNAGKPRVLTRLSKKQPPTLLMHSIQRSL